MKIICAGFPKTGTKSMAAALRELGYNVYDIEEHVDLHLDDYMDYFDGRKDSHELMEKYRDVDACVDQPACTMWLTFFKHYPDAKVILMERESAEVWQQSYEKMFNYHVDKHHKWYEQYLSWFSPTHAKWIRFCKNCHVRSAAFIDYFGHRENWGGAECWMYQYEIHNAAVKHIVPRDQLLIYKVGEGWDRLCAFLGHPVPENMPFPKENVGGGTPGNIMDKIQQFKVMDKIQDELKMSFAKILVTGGLFLAAAVGGGVWAFRR